MEMLSEVLPIFIYILLIGLLIISIIIGIKLIITMNKINKIVNDVEDKINALNGIFSIIEATSNKITAIYTKLVDGVWGVVDKIFNSKKERIEEDE